MTLDGACCARSPIKSSFLWLLEPSLDEARDGPEPVDGKEGCRRRRRQPVYFELVVRSLEGVTLLKNTKAPLRCAVSTSGRLSPFMSTTEIWVPMPA